MPYVLGLDVLGCALGLGALGVPPVARGLGAFGVALGLGALGVPPVARGLVGLDFCAVGLGALGVPNFFAFCVLLLRLI